VNPHLRVFLSSTFSDFDRERRAIQGVALPRLRHRFASMGIQYDLIDLRWGITEQAQHRSDTMRICLEEIRRCQRLSPRPNFALLLGDRYGWQPLPSLIPVSHWKWLMAFSGRSERKLIQSRYRGPDRNVVPAVYRLDAYDDNRAPQDQENISLLNALRAAADSAGFSSWDRLPYFASATHQEIALGALDPALVPDPEEHVRVYVRSLSGDLTRSDLRHFVDWDKDRGERDHDAAQALQVLRSEILNRLGTAVRVYVDNPEDGCVTDSYLDSFIEDFVCDQLAIGERQIDLLKRQSSLEIRASDALILENQLCRNFQGRQDVLQALERYLSIPCPSKPGFLTGPGGCGKSSLIAMAVRRCRERGSVNGVMPRVLTYYIGGVAGSESIESMITTIEAELSRHESGEELTAQYISPQSLAERFKACLQQASAQKPLVIVLDGLDQLEPKAQSHDLDWLPTELPQHVWLLASCRSDSRLHQSLTKRFQANLISVPPIQHSEARAILHAWLDDPHEVYSSAGIMPVQRRRLTQQQESSILSAFHACGRVLWLRVAAEQARTWPSWQRSADLPQTLEGIIQDLFQQHFIKAGRHPTIFAQTAVDFLTASRHGLSEQELNAAMAAHKGVRDELYQENKRTGQIWSDPTSLPPILWSRLYFDLQPFLTRVSRDGAYVYRWFHREFTNVLTEHLLGNADRSHLIHADLASMFERLASSDQALLDQVTAQSAEAISALRRLMEQPFHLGQARLTDSLVNLLFSMPFCMAKCAANRSRELLEDLLLVPDGYVLNQAQLLWFACLRRWSQRLAFGDSSWPAHRILIQLCLETSSMQSRCHRPEYRDLVASSIHAMAATTYVPPFSLPLAISEELESLLRRCDPCLEDGFLQWINQRWLGHSLAAGGFDLYDTHLGFRVDTFNDFSEASEYIIASTFGEGTPLSCETLASADDRALRLITPYGSALQLNELELVLGSSEVICCGMVGSYSLYLCDHSLHLINIGDLEDRAVTGCYLADGSHLSVFGAAQRNYQRFDVVAFCNASRFVSLGWEQTTLRDEVKVEVFAIEDDRVSLQAELICNDGLDLPLGAIGVLEDGRMVFAGEDLRRSYCFRPCDYSGVDELLLWPGVRWSVSACGVNEENQNFYDSCLEQVVAVSMTVDQWSSTSPRHDYPVPHVSLDCDEGSLLLWEQQYENADHDGQLLIHGPERSDGTDGLAKWVADVPIRFVVRLPNDRYLVIKDSGPLLLKIPSVSIHDAHFT